MILIDNTVLSNFALVNELGLLQAYCKDQGGLTNHVLVEFEQGYAREFSAMSNSIG